MIKLSKGYSMIVDDEDFDWANQFLWHATYSSKYCPKPYARRTKKKENGKWPKVYAHQDILGVQSGNFHIDHINGDTLDNRRSNLRVTTKRENWSNTWKHRRGLLIGANYDKTRNKWVSRISVNGKSCFLGVFGDQESAHKAYLNAVSQLEALSG